MTILPKLYKITNQKIYEWQISLEQKENNSIDIHTIYGYIGGSLITKTTTIEKGKGGRSVMEQATLEAKRKWADKKEKELYSDILPSLMESSLTIIVRPMLAQTFEPNKTKVKYPVFIQRKYDGIRCIASLNQETREVMLESRKGTAFYNFDILKSQIREFLLINPSYYFDGELYTDKIPFETLSGYVRSKKINEKEQEEINKIQYHIYDLYDTQDPNASFSQRLQKLIHVFERKGFRADLIVNVQTDQVNSREEIKQYHAKYVEEGFEGIMIRFPEGIYEVNKRSKYLQKYKEFIEEEFKIIGYHEGDSNEKGCIILDCINKSGESFAVRPRGTFEQRRIWFQNGDEYIGKYITVIFQEYSQGGIPRFPVGKAIRENY
jgi:ATP-dependent DNA ligase